MLESHRGCLVFGRLKERFAGWLSVRNEMLKGGVIITPALRLGDFVHRVGGK